MFTKFLFTIFAPLNPPPPNQQNAGFPLEFLLKGPQTELRTLSQNCEQTLQKLRTNRIMNKRAFLIFAEIYKKIAENRQKVAGKNRIVLFGRGLKDRSVFGTPRASRTHTGNLQKIWGALGRSVVPLSLQSCLSPLNGETLDRRAPIPRSLASPCASAPRGVGTNPPRFAPLPPTRTTKLLCVPDRDPGKASHPRKTPTKIKQVAQIIKTICTI